MAGQIKVPYMAGTVPRESSGKQLTKPQVIVNGQAEGLLEQLPAFTLTRYVKFLHPALAPSAGRRSTSFSLPASAW